MELNEVMNNQKKVIDELKGHILELQKSMGKEQNETNNVYTQITRSFCHIYTMTEEFITVASITKREEVEAKITLTQQPNIRAEHSSGCQKEPNDKLWKQRTYETWSTSE
ncbi:hypothetical protein JTB14_011917 [Gonioctena quinquepunctata]|nr:hypothetical protein JTB14_011917 [Gonioctena quinquepunctata]